MHCKRIIEVQLTQGERISLSRVGDLNFLSFLSVGS